MQLVEFQPYIAKEGMMSDPKSKNALEEARDSLYTTDDGGTDAISEAVNSIYVTDEARGKSSEESSDEDD
jgi:hypothetical protein